MRICCSFLLALAITVRMAHVFKLHVAPLNNAIIFMVCVQELMCVLV